MVRIISTIVSCYKRRRLAGSLGGLMVLLLENLMLPKVYAESPVARQVWSLYNLILIIGIAVGVLVIGTLLYAVVRYREKE